MFFTFTPYTSPLFFFFVQGLIFAFLLLRKGAKYEDQSSKWLSLFVFLCCLYIVPWMLGYSGWYGKDGYRDFLFFVPFQQLFFIGPALYFYTQSLLNRSFKLRKADRWHFLPGVVYLGYSIVVFIVDFFLLEEYYFYANGRDKDLLPWYQNVGVLSMIIYAILSIRYYNSYRKLIFRELSFADTIQFKWINRYLLVFLLMLVFRIVLILFFPQWGEFGSKWWYYLLFSGLAYYIALAGYTNFIEAVVPFKLQQPFGNEAILEPDLEVASPISSPIAYSPKEMKRYDMIENSNLQNSPPSEVTQELKLQLQRLMEKRHLYQNPLLSLTDVATELGVTTKVVSLLVNQGFEKNFNDFVNYYRVQAIKQRFSNGEHQQRTILSIALDCGFNSKTTFNRVFKKLTGQTPVRYISQLDQKQLEN